MEPSTGYLDGTDIARDRGIVVVDEHFRTSDPSVFAIGDLARFYDPLAGHRRLIQHWTNASHQGERLGRTLAGEDAPYDQVAYFCTEVLGIKLGLLGDLDGGHDRTVTHGSLEDGLVSYYLKDDHLVAALISGQTSETQEELTTLLRNHAHLSDLSQPDEARVSR